MKIKSILLAALIALGFAACNNEDAPDLGKQAEGTVSVKVVQSSKSSGVRATGNLSGDGITSPGLAEESAIKGLEVYVFDTLTGALDGYGSAVGDEVKDIKSHAGAKTIMVVANASIGPVSTKTLLEAKTSAVPVDIVTDGLVMTGDASVTLVAGQNYYGYNDDTALEGTHLEKDPLDIVRVNARVAIAKAELDITDLAQKAIFDNLTAVDVAIFNVPKETKLFGASLATNDKYLFGEAWPTTKNSYVPVANGGAVEGTFKDAAVTFPIVVTDAPYYYVTENTSSETNPNKEQMLIVLRGKPTLDGEAVTALGLYTDAAGYTYYPVWVNKDGVTGGNGQVLRNTQYNIYLTIKGIGNPSIDEVEEAFLDVKVVVKAWDVVTQNVTWDPTV